MKLYLLLNLLFYGFLTIGTLSRYHSIKPDDSPAFYETLIALILFSYTVFMLYRN